ncbi:hypothetical protein D9M72_347260 [compost metagenome]
MPVTLGSPLALAGYHHLLVPFPLVRPPGCCVVPAVERRKLTLEFEVALPSADLQRPVGERGLDSTAGLPIMCAVGEAAPAEQLLEVAEHLPHSVLGVEKPEAAHAGGVHEHSSPGQRDKFAGGGGVPAFAVAGPDGPNVLRVVPGEGVDQRGLPGAGGPQEDQRPAGGHVSEQFVEAVALFRRGGDHSYAGGLQDDLSDDVVRDVGKVRFGDNHQRGGPRVPGRHQRPLQPVVGERPVHRDHDSHHIDVGAQDLGLRRRFEGALAAQRRLTRQHSDDGRLPRRVGAEPHPVAGGRDLAVGRVGQVQELRSPGNKDPVPVNADHPSGALPAGGGMGVEKCCRPSCETVMHGTGQR